MNPVTAAKIRNNFEIARKSISTYIVAAITAGGAWWLGKDAPEQLAWLHAHAELAPLIPYAPWISGGLWAIFRLWPQFFPRPAQVNDVTAAKLDELVRKAEALGFKVPAGTAVAAPAVVVPAPPPDIPIDPTLAALKAAGIDPPTLAVALAALRASRA